MNNINGFLLEVVNAKQRLSPSVISEWFDIKSTQKKFEGFKELEFLEHPSLKESLIQEMSFKSLTEYYASKAILDIIKIAPCMEEYDFLNTLLIDETNHSFLFRNYLIENNLIDSKRSMEQMASILSDTHMDVVEPFQAFIKQWVVNKNDFYAGIIIITIILEGVLAPSAELSEKKWLPFYPRASAIQKYANSDEVRHLTLCCDILKRAIKNNANTLHTLKSCIVEGLGIWNTSNINNIIMNREILFQKGMNDNINLLENYYLTKDVMLKDTTPDSRLKISHEMVEALQKSRLRDIGIDL